LNWQKSDGCRDVLLRAKNNTPAFPKQHGQAQLSITAPGRWAHPHRRKDCAE
jgi:hypothetical protein